MEVIHEYFLCEECQGKEFKRIYKFSMRFHGINFSDDLIYDKITDELYQCTKCHRTYTKEQIEEGLEKLKEKNKPAKEK